MREFLPLLFSHEHPLLKHLIYASVIIKIGSHEFRKDKMTMIWLMLIIWWRIKNVWIYVKLVSRMALKNGCVHIDKWFIVISKYYIVCVCILATWIALGRIVCINARTKLKSNLRRNVIRYICIHTHTNMHTLPPMFSLRWHGYIYIYTHPFSSQLNC